MRVSKSGSISQKHVVPILFDKLSYNHLQHKNFDEKDGSPNHSDEKALTYGQNSVRRRVAQLYKDVDNLEMEEMLKVEPLFF